MDEVPTVAALVRSARRAAGLSQEALAARAGLGPSTISKIETGAQVPQLATVRLLGAALDLDEQAVAAMLRAVDRGTGDNGIETRKVEPDHGGRELDVRTLLARHLTDRGLTAAALAKAAGVHPRTVRNLLNGVRATVRPDNARALADALGLAGAGYARQLLVARLQGQRAPLPPLPESIRGRDALLAAVLTLLETHRTVTLTGSAGVGKTVLAEAAADLFGGPVLRLPLARRAPGTDAAVAMASLVATDESEDDDPLGRVRAALPAGALALLDNLEHLTGSAAAVAELLGSRPDVRVLATSRTTLRLPEEAVVDVPPLPGPDAREVFVRVAAAAGRTVTEADVPAVDQICGRLDGLPLAIELAAARSRLLGPAEILAGLDQPERVLRGRVEGADPRHVTLSAAVGWSLDQLGASAVALFARLAVCAAPWPSDLVEAVHDGPDVYDALEDLTDLHLVRPVVLDGGTGEGTTAFSMLQPVRDIATERLRSTAEAGAVRARHALRCLGIAESTAPELIDDDRVAAALARTDALLLHHLDAHTHLVDTDGPAAVRHAAALWRYWLLRARYRTGLGLLRSALAAPGTPARPALATARYGAAVLAHCVGQNDDARRDATAALALFTDLGDLGGIGSVRSLLGMICLHTGDVEGAAAHYRAGMEEAPWSRARRAYTTLLANYAPVQARLGDVAGARASAGEAADRYRQLKDMRSVGATLGNLAVWTSWSGDLDSARDLLREALEIFEERDDLRQSIETHVALAELAVNAGDVDAATAELAVARPAAEQVDDRWSLAMCGILDAEVALLLGDSRRARRELGAARVLADETADPRSRTRALFLAAAIEATSGDDELARRAAAEGVELAGAGDPIMTASLTVLLAVIDHRSVQPPVTPATGAQPCAAAIHVAGSRPPRRDSPDSI